MSKMQYLALHLSMKSFFDFLILALNIIIQEASTCIPRFKVRKYRFHSLKERYLMSDPEVIKLFSC